ncbi:MAG: hypothetical protein WAM58_01280 [Candidatus Acidiferrum sp.]
MNCQQCQQKILDSLAAGESRLAIEVAVHENSCEACSQFLAAQLHLFRSLEIGLRSLVNAPVPASLLPGVRARMEQEPVSRYAAIPRWSFVAVAAAAILAVSAAYVLRHSANRLHLPQTISAPASQTAANPETSTTPLRESPTLFTPPASTRVIRARPSPPDPQVIVSTEERQAYAKFVAEAPEQEADTLALAPSGQPVPEAAEDPAEIALLQIESLEVKPLEATESE